MHAPSARVSTALLAARSLFEGIFFASAAALAHGMLLPRGPLWLLAAVVALSGAAFALAVVLRDQADATRSRNVTVAVLVAAAAWGVSLPALDRDGLAVLTRIVVFGFLGEAFLWRSVSLARDVARWDATRGAIGLAAIGLIVVAIAPFPVDRRQLPPLGLLLAFAGASALSLARASEELALAGRDARGGAPTGASRLTAVVVGLVSLVVAIELPAAEALVARVGDVVGPIALALFVLALTPVFWVLELLEPAFEALRQMLLRAFLGRPPLPFQSGDPAEILAQQRAIEETRPFIFGAVEILLLLVALVVAIVIFERIVTERRAKLGTGEGIDRETVDGIGIREMLAGLLPRRAARRLPPRDDGSLASRARRLYWDFLAHSERAGVGWRADTESPRAHFDRQRASDAAWASAAPIVSVFEDVRYGEREPSRDQVSEAEAALKVLRTGGAGGRTPAREPG